MTVLGEARELLRPLKLMSIFRTSTYIDIHVRITSGSGGRLTPLNLYHLSRLPI